MGDEKKLGDVTTSPKRIPIDRPVYNMTFDELAKLPTTDKWIKLDPLWWFWRAFAVSCGVAIVAGVWVVVWTIVLIVAEAGVAEANRPRPDPEVIQRMLDRQLGDAYE